MMRTLSTHFRCGPNSPTVSLCITTLVQSLFLCRNCRVSTILTTHLWQHNYTTNWLRKEFILIHHFVVGSRIRMQTWIFRTIGCEVTSCLCVSRSKQPFENNVDTVPMTAHWRANLPASLTAHLTAHLASPLDSTTWQHHLTAPLDSTIDSTLDSTLDIPFVHSISLYIFIIYLYLSLLGVVNVLSTLRIFFRAKIFNLGNFRLCQSKSSNFDHPKTLKINKLVFFSLFLERTHLMWKNPSKMPRITKTPNPPLQMQPITC